MRYDGWLLKKDQQKYEIIFISEMIRDKIYYLLYM